MSYKSMSQEEVIKAGIRAEYIDNAIHKVEIPNTSGDKIFLVKQSWDSFKIVKYEAPFKAGFKVIGPGINRNFENEYEAKEFYEKLKLVFTDEKAVAMIETKIDLLEEYAEKTLDIEVPF